MGESVRPDQAESLRELVRASVSRPAAPSASGPRARVIAVTSGKGGVGKTNVTVNLAIALAERGRRVVLFDADLGLANVDIVMGLSPDLNLTHVVRGQRSVREILVTGPAGVSVVPSGSGVRELADLAPSAQGLVLSALAELERLCDVLLVDTGAGIHASVRMFLRAADEVLVVTTPEPTALLDAYGLIKAFAAEEPGGRVRVIVNQAATLEEADEVYERLAAAARQFLQFEVGSLGWVPRDPRVPEAVRRQRPLLALYPQSEASRAFRTLAGALSGGPAASNGDGFFGKLARLFRS